MEDSSIAMNGGDGPNSYTQNSKYQAQGLDKAKLLITNSIKDKLIIQITSPQVFTIADLGCSVGPNTFAVVQTIIDSVNLKFKTQILDPREHEFQVFFNDHSENDFNTLFKALPQDRQYTAAGVPGSFRRRLFPKFSMNFMHSSYALHWLSKVPEKVTKKDSSAWNKGKITYLNGSDEVVEAFRAQFLVDTAEFFQARAVELAKDGLMMILMPCRPAGSQPSETLLVHVFDCLGNVLNDMAKEDHVEEALVDSFNVPIFTPTAAEVKEIVLKNECLSIETVEEIYHPTTLITPEAIRLCKLHVRSITEGMLSKHFGSEIIDELFERYSYKLEEFSKSPAFDRIEKVQDLFLLVKRKRV